MGIYYTNKIVYNQYGVYYIVKSYSNNTMRIEQLKKRNDCNDVISIQQIQSKHKHLNIIYYGYGTYDKK